MKSIITKGKVACIAGTLTLLAAAGFAQQPLDYVWQASFNNNYLGATYIPGSPNIAVIALNKVEIRNATTGAVVRVVNPLLPGNVTIGVRTLAATTDKLIFAQGTTAFIYDIPSDTFINRVPLGVTPNSLVASPLGDRFAVASAVSAGSHLRVWDLNNLEAGPQVLVDPVNPVAATGNAAAFSPDGTRVFAAEYGTSALQPNLRVWNISDGSVDWRRIGIGNVFQWVFSSTWRNPGEIVVGFENWPSTTTNLVYRIDAATGATLSQTDFTPAASINSVAQLVSGGILAGTGQTPGTYGISADGLSTILFSNSLPVNQLAAAPTGNNFVAAVGGDLTIYEAQVPVIGGDPTILFRTFNPTPDALAGTGRNIAVSPNGDFVATGQSASNVFRVYNGNTGALVVSVTLPNTADRPRAFAFNPASTVLAVAMVSPTGFFTRIEFFEPATGLPAPGTTTAFAPDGNLPNALQFTADGLRVMYAEGTTAVRRIRMYTVSDGTLFAESPQLGVSASSILFATFNPATNRIAAVTNGTGAFQLHTLTVAAPSINLDASTPSQPTIPNWCDWSATGDRIVVGFASGGTPSNGRVAHWDANNLATPPVEMGGVLGNAVLSVTFNNATGTVYATSNAGINVFSVAQNRSVLQIAGTPGIVNDIAFNTAGTRFAAVTSLGRVFMANAPEIGPLKRTVFFQELSSRLIVGWNAPAGVVSLPVVTIDFGPDGWEPRAFGRIEPTLSDEIYFQNLTSREIGFWSLTPAGVPTMIGIMANVPASDWVLRAAGDINGDGVDDMIFQNTTNHAVAAWIRNANGVITSTPLIGFAVTAASEVYEVRGAGFLNAAPGLEIVLYSPTTQLTSIWSLNLAGVLQPGSTVVGAAESADWQLRGVLQGTPSSNYLVFENTVTGGVWYWEINNAGAVLSTGQIGERPSGWVVRGIGGL